MVATNGLPLMLHAGLDVALLPPPLKGPRWRKVVSCTQLRDAQLVTFQGVGSLDGASKLVGKTVLARTADLPDDFGLSDADALLGREVLDVHMGSIGLIDEVMRGPANDVWVVNGPYGEVLVPAVREFVKSWLGDGPVEVDLPRGLVNEGNEEL